MSERGVSISTISFTCFALVAFAANSLLCRLALGNASIDAASFTAIRLLSGALVLVLLVGLKNKRQAKASSFYSMGSWWGALYLFLYAAGFSFAYLSLDTGTGALILFACVQFAMLAFAFIQGERLALSAWFAVLVSFSGLLYLFLPGASTPSLIGFILMAVSGLAWAGYSILGKTSHDALAATCGNFVRCLPLVLVLLVVFRSQLELTLVGCFLACIAGAITSGLGYALWYRALAGLSVSMASLLQLSVPILAALAGLIFIGELLSQRLIISSLLVLGGIALLIVFKQRQVGS